ncbi:MAG: response regulator [Deltaproteobacteria bacterium]|nr:response regulator [Deltaproteobacteria bacterium]
MAQVPFEILLVEDNSGDIVLLREALDESAIETRLHATLDGESALRFLESRLGAPPHLILLDLSLPRMDGRAFLKRIKSQEALRSIPVIVLTSSALDSDVLEAYDHHASAYIVKPADMMGLADTVRSLLDFWCTKVRLPRRARG